MRTYLQFIKRVLIVKQLLSDPTIAVSTGQLNWIGSMMVAKVEETNLSTLIWELFVDIFNYENFTFLCYKYLYSYSIIICRFLITFPK